MAKSNLSAVPSSPKINTTTRLELALDAGEQLPVIIDLIRKQIGEMISAETHEQEVALGMYLDRLEILADAICQLARTTDDHAQSYGQLDRIVRNGVGGGYYARWSTLAGDKAAEA